MRTQFLKTNTFNEKMVSTNILFRKNNSKYRTVRSISMFYKEATFESFIFFALMVKLVSQMRWPVPNLPLI